MASASRRYTVGEFRVRLDGNFDIPDNGVSSDVEWLDDEDFEEPDVILPADSAILPDKDNKEIDLRTVDIGDAGNAAQDIARGRQSNV